MRALLIVNPHATATTERRKDLLAAALAASMELTIAHTEYRGHATELAAGAVKDGIDLVIAHGGDGTVNEVTNGLLGNSEPGNSRPRNSQFGNGQLSNGRPLHGPQSNLPLLAIVPGGSTNVFARAIGIDPDPTGATEQIMEGLRRGRTRVVSLGKVGSRYFTFNAGLGLDAQVVHTVEAHRARGNRISNSLHIRRAVRAFFAFDRRHPQLTVTATGHEPTEAFIALISNVTPWTYAGRRAVYTNPDLPADRGLGLLALKRVRTVTVLRLLRQLVFRAKGPKSKTILRVDNAQQITVKSAKPLPLQVDGDYIGEESAVIFESIPDALRVVI